MRKCDGELSNSNLMRTGAGTAKDWVRTIDSSLVLMRRLNSSEIGTNAIWMNDAHNSGSNLRSAIDWNDEAPQSSINVYSFEQMRNNWIHDSWVHLHANGLVEA
jgi:hypothetical protein